MSRYLLAEYSVAESFSSVNTDYTDEPGCCCMEAEAAARQTSQALVQLKQASASQLTVSSYDTAIVLTQPHNFLWFEEVAASAKPQVVRP